MVKNIRMEDLPIYEIEVDEEGNQGIRMISLVSDPAISVMGMYFSSDIEQEFRFKSVKEQQIIVGPAIIPDKKILRKDNNDNYYYVYFTKDTIRKMVEKFIKENNNKSLNIDHSNRMVPGFIQSSWIVEDSTYDKSRYYGFNLPIGTFFIEVKIDDKEFWLNEVKEEGRYGFSIEGIMGQKLVQMAKISFDFDGTLSQDKIKKIAKEKIANGDDVYIITKRAENEYVKEIAKEIGIKSSNVIFTNHKPKWSFVKDLGIDVHYDNVEAEGKEIENKTNAKVEIIESNVNYNSVIVDLPKYIDELIDDLGEDEIEDIMQCFEDSYDDYPKAATENAKIALRWAEENGWGSCGTPVGKARANQLAKGESITRNTIARMAAFERHRQNSKKELGDGCGRLMWLAWGGDEGIEWASRKLKQIDEKFAEEFAEVGPRGGIKESKKAPKSNTPNPNPKGDGSAKGSASNTRSAIVTKRVEDILSQKVKDFNDKYKDKLEYGANIGMLKTVYQRGVGAFNVSHSPEVKSAEQWALARVNAFLYLLKNGRPENSKYKGDNDLLPSKHPKYNEMEKEEFVVNPGEKESKDDFISRCIGIEISSGKSQEQATAICYTKWDEK